VPEAPLATSLLRGSTMRLNKPRYCCNYSAGVALKCAVRHERNVGEEQHHILEARTSDNRVIPMEWP